VEVGHCAVADAEEIAQRHFDARLGHPVPVNPQHERTAGERVLRGNRIPEVRDRARAGQLGEHQRFAFLDHARVAVAVQVGTGAGDAPGLAVRKMRQSHQRVLARTCDTRAGRHGLCMSTGKGEQHYREWRHHPNRIARRVLQRDKEFYSDHG
jgi:hypothetical protein